MDLVEQSFRRSLGILLVRLSLCPYGEAQLTLESLQFYLGLNGLHVLGVAYMCYPVVDSVDQLRLDLREVFDEFIAQLTRWWIAI